jgi:hypothetical protein
MIPSPEAFWIGWAYSTSPRVKRLLNLRQQPYLLAGLIGNLLLRRVQRQYAPRRPACSDNQLSWPSIG